MKTNKEYLDLLNSIESACRIMEGVGVSFAGSGHMGLSAFSRCEAWEMKNFSIQVIRHIEGQNGKITLIGHRAPPCEHKDPVSAIKTMIEAYKKIIICAETLKDKIISSIEDPYFLDELIKKIHYHLDEVYEVEKCLIGGDDLNTLNIELLTKYNLCQR